MPLAMLITITAPLMIDVMVVFAFVELKKYAKQTILA
jgi:hypothetical protein